MQDLAKWTKRMAIANFLLAMVFIFFLPFGIFVSFFGVTPITLLLLLYIFLLAELYINAATIMTARKYSSKPQRIFLFGTGFLINSFLLRTSIPLYFLRIFLNPEIIGAVPFFKILSFIFAPQIYLPLSGLLFGMTILTISKDVHVPSVQSNLKLVAAIHFLLTAIWVWLAIESQGVEGLASLGIAFFAFIPGTVKGILLPLYTAYVFNKWSKSMANMSLSELYPTQNLHQGIEGF
ncbi:MAG: hypothetical protein D6732_21615 [Methanobacteriota archaeon]|nr:MAG: hypothetical protein D6732_21615 [Euryarchaeota archaeon]